ncbi:uncharacterized protein ASPGLDRAFT_1114220 [Aspergillus glaucus CBS 516.65]|uniref:Uncharacterized protein n=1 Tax=Aspergillus glaucus CBS 516.65 TaxID=1160497 RepID=A0A1L9VSW2_ASPGL|nr:hypothetical protein ASPGLDRAFT_1114220 [Aspergillus glaucus CBS 516.65]OJJ86992.1 hypothetical protein ASPGLDRAFT_1114220 [Aspergillus glaucus CBS 516.65]
MKQFSPGPSLHPTGACSVLSFLFSYFVSNSPSRHGVALLTFSGRRVITTLEYMDNYTVQHIIPGPTHHPTRTYCRDETLHTPDQSAETVNWAH